LFIIFRLPSCICAMKTVLSLCSPELHSRVEMSTTCEMHQSVCYEYGIVSSQTFLFVFCPRQVNPLCSQLIEAMPPKTKITASTAKKPNGITEKSTLEAKAK
jgi:hypothetical protein